MRDRLDPPWYICQPVGSGWRVDDRLPAPAADDVDDDLAPLRFTGGRLDSTTGPC